MATVDQNTPQQSGAAALPDLDALPVMKVVSHSMFFYWWPVWAAGYIMALLTYVQGDLVTVGGTDEWYHPSKNLGVLYTVVFLMVILFTNVSLRGKTSVIAILSVLFITVLFAYLEWWDYILGLLPYLSVRMNLGYYLFFSTVLFVAWVFTVFVYDQLSYWEVQPGQLTHRMIIGWAEKSYDTRGMLFEKHHEDVFRHWILGLGSGDIHITTSGANREELHLTNVLFVDHKVNRIQQLIAIKPDSTPGR